MTTITPGAWLTSNVTGIDFGADQIRTILHLLGVSVWLGGQILMLGLLPVLRELGGEAPKLAAAGFGRVAWPAFGLTIVTGIWNILEVDLADVTSGYNALFGIKMILVVVTGVAAAMHQSTNKPAIRAITGALGFAAALGAFMLGATMSH
ncbi:MAG: putative copper export protein [Acidimicrobiales bacterium]